jgi:methyl coenzyme M reductase subunit D
MNKKKTKTSQYCFSTLIKVLPFTTREDKERKNIQMEKEKINLSLSADDIIVNLEYLKEVMKISSGINKLL